ncbi:hypothetical protein [Deinococcus marmoris]|uniref:hypothetical protein n=1 Tax=Deinococcus marmoris TaxID=249408 RepID=UPI000496B045|nr:hypothetical protein [Deinococcus marmoris]
MLLAALVCPGITGCVPAHTQSTHLLRPGTTITGAGGVRVSAPAQWREGPQAGVRVTITRLPRDTLAWPIKSGARLGLPIYRVEAEVPVLTDDRDRFTVTIPVGTADPAFLAPLLLSTGIADSDGPGGSFTVWADDPSATLEGNEITFRITGFVDETHLFTAALLDVPRTWTKR